MQRAHTRSTLPPDAARSLARGVVIPAHPLALTEHLDIDVTRQRALTRYYLDAGAGGIAIGVHKKNKQLKMIELFLKEN